MAGGAAGSDQCLQPHPVELEVAWVSGARMRASKLQYKLHWEGGEAAWGQEAVQWQADFQPENLLQWWHKRGKEGLIGKKIEVREGGQRHRAKVVAFDAESSEFELKFDSFRGTKDRHDGWYDLCRAQINWEVKSK